MHTIPKSEAGELNPCGEENSDNCSLACADAGRCLRSAATDAAAIARTLLLDPEYAALSPRQIASSLTSDTMWTTEAWASLATEAGVPRPTTGTQALVAWFLNRTPAQIHLAGVA